MNKDFFDLVDDVFIFEQIALCRYGFFSQNLKYETGKTLQGNSRSNEGNRRNTLRNMWKYQRER